jgi:hypothetical protein
MGWQKLKNDKKYSAIAHHGALRILMMDEEGEHYADYNLGSPVESVGKTMFRYEPEGVEISVDVRYKNRSIPNIIVRCPVFMPHSQFSILHPANDGYDFMKELLSIPY